MFVQAIECLGQKRAGSREQASAVPRRPFQPGAFEGEKELDPWRQRLGMLLQHYLHATELAKTGGKAAIFLAALA